MQTSSKPRIPIFAAALCFLATLGAAPPLMAQISLPFGWVDTSPSPMLTGERGQLKAKLQDTSWLKRGIRSKRVYFFVDDQLIGTSITNGDGIASYSYTPRAAGSFSLKVVFEGDKGHQAAEKTSSITVNEPEKSASQISWIEADPETLEVNRRGLLKVKLEDTSFFKRDIPSKRIRFYIDDNLIATGITSGSGVAMIPYTPRAAGTINVKATFEGDRAYNSAEETAQITIGEPARKETKFR